MRNPLRALYSWVLRQAERRHAPWVLFWVALAEASVFPLPPDVLLVPSVLARPDRAWLLAGVCTLGSLLGGVVGYAIGAWGMATIGQWIVATYHLEAGFDHFQAQFNEWGLWIILLKGFTPVPYKLVTIASGVGGLNLALFTAASFVTRGGRFLMVALLVRRYGAQVSQFIDVYMNRIALVIVFFVIAGFWLALG